MATNPWQTIDSNLVVGLSPWEWVQLESSEPPGPFPFLGGVEPDVVNSLHQVHGIMMSGVETAISDILAKRATLEDDHISRRLEDAYAEVVQSRPPLQRHIQCGRRADGAFQWEYQKNPTAVAKMVYGGLRVFNAATRQAFPFGFERAVASKVGNFLGFLSGRHTMAEIQTVAQAQGRDLERELAHFFTLLKDHDCLAITPNSSIESHWRNITRDQDVVHLGHAALMYRNRDSFFVVRPLAHAMVCRITSPVSLGQSSS